MAKQDRVKLKYLKANFLLLTKQYSQMGKLIRALAQDPGSKDLLAKVGLQYHEIGEQLKNVGLGLDDLGGEPMMRPRKPGRNPSTN